MDNNYFQIKLLFLLVISIILSLNPVATLGETQDTPEEEESKEFENALVKNVRDDYSRGFLELLNFINTINDTLGALKTQIETQDSKLELRFNTLNSSQDIKFTMLNAKVDKLSEKSNFLKNMVVNTWEGFDSFIRTQAKQIRTGNSFNGSTLSDIKSRAAQVGYDRRYTAIVIVNHLDEAIGDFTIYQPYYNFLYTPAPNSVPGRTQEVFTFVTSDSSHAGGAFTSFSYAIPSFGIRVAAISYHGTRGVGLAFVPKEADMNTYWNSRKGIEGSTVWECCGYMDRNLSVGYRNLYARIFADDEGNYKSTLRIELIKLPLDE